MPNDDGLRRSELKALAGNLARSLTRADWSLQTLEHAFARRLPIALEPYGKALATSLITRLPAAYAPSVKAVTAALLETSELKNIYLYCMRNGVWPSHDLSVPVMAPITAFDELDLPQMPTVSDLADWVMVPVPRLMYLADAQYRFETHGDMAVNHYHYRKKEKASGVRLLEAPKANLKSVQRQILRGILEKMSPHDDAFGFIKERNCLQAAQRHVFEEVVVSFDIASFFPSIDAGRVFGLFRCLGYPEGVARCLTGLCTTITPARVSDRLQPADRMIYRTPHLPQGAPTSPALANQMVFRLDCRLSGLARSLNAHYSRYADDLTFSGDKRIVNALLRAVPEIVSGEGFRLNPKKTRAQPHHVPQRVTGVGVNRRLNIDRASFDHLKAVIHACGKAGDNRLQDASFREQLLGKVGWVEAVNPRRGQKLRRLLERAWIKRFSD